MDKLTLELNTRDVIRLRDLLILFTKVPYLSNTKIADAEWLLENIEYELREQGWDKNENPL